MKIAICGSAPTSKDDAPFEDSSWQIWGLAFNPPKCYDALFEVHHRGLWALEPNPAWYLEFLQKQKCPIYMVKKEKDIPASKVIPFEALCEEFGNYFTSSCAYMIGMAMLQGASEIGLWGVDMAGGKDRQGAEYTIQRPCCEYLLGIAKGRGIKVFIPEASPLLKATHAYGREDPPEVSATISLEFLQSKRDALLLQKQEVDLHLRQAEANWNALDGAIQTLDTMMQTMKLTMAGFQVGACK